MSNQPVLLEMRNVSKKFRASGEAAMFSRELTAVRNVSLHVYTGETLGIVGESGCGKSTIAKLVMGLEKPSSGEILLKGQRIDDQPESRLRKIRPSYQLVFQDSGSSLNPRKRIREILRQPMIYHHIVSPADVDARIAALLEQVGMQPETADRYPHELSGGQRQRICIAKALSLNPELIVLDEPVSALDVSVQAQILNLLRDLQEKLGLTYIFIGHGLGAVHYISHRIAVMYMGEVIETGPAEDLFHHPCHPYTRALVDAAPSADYSERGRERITLKGELTVENDGRCALKSRCPYATEACAHAKCEMVDVGNGHFTTCRRAAE